MKGEGSLCARHKCQRGEGGREEAKEGEEAGNERGWGGGRDSKWREEERENYRERYAGSAPTNSNGAAPWQVQGLGDGDVVVGEKRVVREGGMAEARVRSLCVDSQMFVRWKLWCAFKGLGFRVKGFSVRCLCLCLCTSAVIN